MIGKGIRIIRNKKGLTLKQFAKLVDRSPNTISRIENSSINPSVPLLSKIAEVLEIHVVILFWLGVEEGEIRDKDLYHILRPTISRSLHQLLK